MERHQGCFDTDLKEVAMYSPFAYQTQAALQIDRILSFLAVILNV